MPYPAKTDRDSILKAALSQVGEAGVECLSIRGVAASLGLAPNALYRYFADKAELESAVTSHGSAALHGAMKKAKGQRVALDGLRAVCGAYRKFSHDERFLYETVMQPCDPGREDVSEQVALWDFFVACVADVCNTGYAREAAVALWAFLHGLSVLERAPVLGPQGTSGAFEFGLETFLLSLNGRSQGAAHGL